MNKQVVMYLTFKDRRGNERFFLKVRNELDAIRLTAMTAIGGVFGSVDLSRE